MGLQFHFPAALQHISEGVSAKGRAPLFLSSTGVSGSVSIEAGFGAPAVRETDVLIVSLIGELVMVSIREGV